MNGKPLAQDCINRASTLQDLQVSSSQRRCLTVRLRNSLRSNTGRATEEYQIEHF